VFLSLDFIYLPAPDFDATLAFYTGTLGGRLVWKVRGMETIVARIELSAPGPALLLAEHLSGGSPILIYRVADLDTATEALHKHGLESGHSLELPVGPCFCFEAPGAQRVAIYERVRPFVEEAWTGRIDARSIHHAGCHNARSK
jgi:catechol 2,3-dioxygenase-like lactoylglutathione lyase family enzyme